MDETRTIFWDAMKHLWPAHAEVSQAEPGNLRVTYLMNDDPARPNKTAQWVSVRFDPKVITEMEGADAKRRREIATKAAKLVEWRMVRYDPNIQKGQAFIVEIDGQALDR